ncbi:hypothetical protein F53441_8761 [Fusarium austroafricanum]|uniref:AB hydrolase-1 domain-containing protein n=1 Tax=Fusarium austroafricanum TaxID=2364996 RepID=A0A8H4KAM4_9HYPO|nr:hypothetical protein F53441_8761 [Fusarium austroafricanum]
MASPALIGAEQELFFVNLNQDKPTTVVLLHGLLNSHIEWCFVIPHLSDYHIIAPDISGHSQSRDILPADISSSTERVAVKLRGMRWHGELLKEMRRNRRWEVIYDVDIGLMELNWEDVKTLPVRTLAIAAESTDDVEAVRRMGREMPIEGSLGAVVRGAIHTWNLQKPELFADVIRAWIEQSPLPEGLEVLR